jgi:DNA-binding NtrC family response regulator
MTNLVANGMHDAEGPIGLVVADDDELRESMGEVLRELGYSPAPHTFCSAARETLRVQRAPVALALLCVGRGLPDEMRAVAELLASPALAGADVLLGITAAERDFPALPRAGRAARVAFLRMPFDLSRLDSLARERVAVASRVPALRPATVAWDGAVDQRRAEPCGPRNSYAWALLADPWLQLQLADLRADHVVRAC